MNYNYYFCIVTTLAHLFAIIPIYHDTLYITIIILSTLSSAIWHIMNEKKNIVFYIDYIMATILVIYELYISYNTFIYTKIILNFMIFIINKITNKCYNYKTIHGIWHIMSAIKCYYISYYVKNIDKY
jgi:hypothetical protein